MRKTCKCGVTLSDTIVPNNVVFWTYKATEKNQLIKNFEGEFTDLTQIAICTVRNVNDFTIGVTMEKYIRMH